MNSERRAEIIKIRNCVPFIEPDAGVDETQAAFDELLAALDAADAAQPDDRLARAVAVLQRISHADDCDCEPTDWRCPHDLIDPVYEANAFLASLLQPPAKGGA